MGIETQDDDINSAVDAVINEHDITNELVEWLEECNEYLDEDEDNKLSMPR